jgi:DNA-binding response OmpR family regulator
VTVQKQPARILLADGDSLTRRFVKSLLQRQGHEVIEAEDGEEALRAAAESAPALLVLELVLPLKDGFEVLETLKADARTRRLPVLILSVRSREEDVVKGLKLGAEDFVTKPFHAQELLLRVRKILERTW